MIIATCGDAWWSIKSYNHAYAGTVVSGCYFQVNPVWNISGLCWECCIIIGITLNGACLVFVVHSISCLRNLLYTCVANKTNCYHPTLGWKDSCKDDIRRSDEGIYWSGISLKS